MSVPIFARVRSFTFSSKVRSIVARSALGVFPVSVFEGSFEYVVVCAGVAALTVGSTG